MATRRGRIRITGFETDRVEARDPVSEWTGERETESESRWKRALRDFRANRSAMVGLAVVVALALLAAFARPIEIAGVTIQPIALAPYEPDAILYARGLDVGTYDPPSLAHPFGTDGSARDLFSRVLFGGRFSLSIGFIVVIVTASIGLVYGAISGYYGGWVDEVMMRAVDLIFAFPALVLALIIIAVLGKGYWELVLAFTLFGWAGYARLIRGEILKVKENEYVTAAKALGARDRTVIFRHVVPNAVAPLIVQASLSIGTVVIGVAALGFLGLGMPPSSAEWGTMLDATRETIVQGPGGAIPWWATVFPGGAIFLFVMSMNLIGDGINDALDAQEQGTVAQQGGGG
ncbi:MAG: ABC transporter permease [Haloarculaceae archaeon]